MKPLSANLPPAQQRLLVTLLIGLATLALAYQAILRPLAHRRAALAAELDTAMKRQVLIRQVEAATDTLNRLQTRLPPQRDTAAVLQELSALAARHQLVITAMTPQAPQAFGPYARFPVLVTAEGTYAQLIPFLDALAHTTMPIQVERLDLAPNRPILGTPEDLVAAPLTVRLTVSTLLREG